MFRCSSTAKSGQRRLQRRVDDVPLPRDVDLEHRVVQPRLGDRAVGADVAEPDAGARRSRPRPRWSPARPGTPSRSSSSPPHSIGARVVDDERDQPAPRTALAPARRGAPPAPPGRGSPCRPSARSRRPARPRRACSPGVSSRAERAVALLQPQRLDRVVAGVGHAQVRALAHAAASYTPAASSTGTISSQPSSPTYVIRVARTVASPSGTSRLVANGNASSPRSASVSRCSRSRDRGPITPSTAYAVVTSRTRASQPVREVPADPVLVADRGGRAADQQELRARRPG